VLLSVGVQWRCDDVASLKVALRRGLLSCHPDQFAGREASLPAGVLALLHR